MLRLTHYTTCHGCDGTMHQWRRDNGHSHPSEERLRRLQARRDEDNRLIAVLDEQNRAIRAGELFAKHPTLPGSTDPEQVRHGAVASMTVEFYNQGPERLREATAEVLQGQYVGNRKRNPHGLCMNRKKAA